MRVALGYWTESLFGCFKVTFILYDRSARHRRQRFGILNVRISVEVQEGSVLLIAYAVTEPSRCLQHVGRRMHDHSAAVVCWYPSEGSKEQHLVMLKARNQHLIP